MNSQNPSGTKRQLYSGPTPNQVTAQPAKGWTPYETPEGHDLKRQLKDNHGQSTGLHSYAPVPWHINYSATNITGPWTTTPPSGPSAGLRSSERQSTPHPQGRRPLTSGLAALSEPLRGSDAVMGGTSPSSSRNSSPGARMDGIEGSRPRSLSPNKASSPQTHTQFISSGLTKANTWHQDQNQNEVRGRGR